MSHNGSGTDSGPLSSTADSYLVVVVLFITYGIGIIPFVYWLSFRFNSAPRALAMLLVFNIATGAGLGTIDHYAIDCHSQCR